MFRRLAALAILVAMMGGLGLGVHAQGGTGVVFQDDFSTDTGAWVTGPRDSGERVIEGGQLRITDLDTNITTASYLQRTYADLEIEFDSILRSGNDRGWHVLYLRYQDSDNYHAFAFHAAGRVYGFTMLGGERIVWQGIADSAAIRTGFGLVNHVRATAYGDTLRFYINGELVMETIQPGLLEGRVALVVSAQSGDSANGPTEVAFDNVVIRAPLADTSAPLDDISGPLDDISGPLDDISGPAQEAAVVSAILFWKQDCPYCAEVINTVLPPLSQRYGAQLTIRLIEVATDEDWAMLRQAASQYGDRGDGVPLLIIGDRVLTGSDVIAAELPGLIEAALAAGGTSMPDIPGLEAAALVVNARCEEISVPPPAITSDDAVTVEWVWTARDPSYLEPHRQAVSYMVMLDGIPLRVGEPVYETTDAGDYTIHALTWTVDVGRLSAGQHRVDYVATWSRAVSNGRAAYGPGTENPVHTGGCTFQVTAGARTTPVELSQVALADLEALDYGRIAASLLPPVDPARIQQLGVNGTGLPAYITYAFEPEEIAPGVFVDTTVAWLITAEAIQPALRWEFRNEGGVSGTVEYIADIPKSFASTVADIKFSLPPTEVIQDDPIVKWLIDIGEAINRRIDARTTNMMSLSHPSAVIPLLEQFQGGLRDISLRRQFQACQRLTGPLEAPICALTVLVQNPEYFDKKICDTLPRDVTGGATRADAVFAEACRNLLEPYDNLHCNAIRDANEREACLILTRNVLASACEGLTGLERDLCLYDVAVHSAQPRGCEAISEADMVQDCRAQLSGDPAYCAEISDPARREACCAIFQADADQYAACMGVREVEPGSEVIIEGDTLTLDEVLGTGDAGEEGGGAYGPLPAAPSLDYLMNPAFYAEYTCEGQSERPRFVASDGQFFYAGDTERSFPLPANLTTTMGAQGHDEFAMTSMFMMGTPGLWMPLDGSVYSLPGVTEGWATDAESFDRYSTLELRPAPETLVIGGMTLDVIRYEGSYTDEMVNDNRNSTYVDGYASSVDTLTFRAWYDRRTGLLVKSHFQREPVSCTREGDYADNDCPQPVEMACTLAETSLPLGR